MSLLFELLTILSLILLTAICTYNCFLSLKEQPVNKSYENASWCIHANPIGIMSRKHGFKANKSSHEVSLHNTSYLLGNRRTDNLQIPVSGMHICCYLNVQEHCIYLTVLKGEVSINGTPLLADPKKRVPLNSGSTLRFDNTVELLIQHL